MKRKIRRMTLFVSIALVTGLLVFWALRFTGSKPDHLGGALSALPPCPSSPNCVCSQNSDAAHAIASFAVPGDPDTAWTALRAALEELPRVRVITVSSGYLHAERRTAFFRFVDDMEFLLAEDGRSIEARSASRAGYSDLGENRRRLEQLRRVYLDRLK